MDDIGHRIAEALTRTAPALRDVAAWDGLRLRTAEWAGGDGLPMPGLPLLALPGVVRTLGDFVPHAELLGRRFVTLDYTGRGGSQRARHIDRYTPEATLRDVMDVCVALHLHRAVVIGTSFGGLLAMALAAARPGLVAGVVLNDIGPEIGGDGAELVERIVGHDPAFPDFESAVAYLRRHVSFLSLRTDQEWREFAALTYAQDEDGRWHPLWDTRIARLMSAPRPDLWRLFHGLAGVPVLLVRGGCSTLLTAETVARMRAERPDMRVATVPDCGHTPTLLEPEALAAIQLFLRDIG